MFQMMVLYEYGRIIVNLGRNQSWSQHGRLSKTCCLQLEVGHCISVSIHFNAAVNVNSVPSLVRGRREFDVESRGAKHG
jgi:hypothetical protein